ncbi:MAG: AAA family ATPase [Janthinobacterium lividum]
MIMQYRDRSFVTRPDWFTSSHAVGLRLEVVELLGIDRERRAQTSARRDAPELFNSSVLEGLNFLFDGRCAFCEAATRTRPYRFRPAAEAQPVEGQFGHLYYAWLAEDWDNIYAICEICDPERPDYFPVIGERMPLPSAEALRPSVETGEWPRALKLDQSVLLDPCRDRNFTTHLMPQSDGVLRGVSVRGEPTVDHFNLNHPKRVAQRFEMIADGLHELLAAAALNREADRRDAVQSITVFARREFGGVWALYLRRLVIELKRRMGAPPRQDLAGVTRFLVEFIRRGDAASEIQEAAEVLKEQDAAKIVPTRRIERSAQNEARLVGVSIRDFKALEALAFEVGDGRSGVTSKGEAQSLLILGENAAGKSTILEAIAMAMSDRAALDQLKIDPVDYRLNPEMMGGAGRQRSHSQVELRFSMGEDRVMQISPVGLSAHGRAELPPVFAYGAFRQYVDSVRRYSAARSVMSLFKTDALLSRPDKWLLSLKDDRFEAVVRTLRSIISIGQDFEVIRRDVKRQRCMVVFRADTPSGPVETLTPLHQVSSGFRSVLAMVCDVLEGLMHPRINPGFETFATARGVLLIDEIEAHLHPRWKMQIMRGLRTALPQMTIIATTHDPLCLRGMEDGEVMVLHRIAGATTDETELPVFVERLTELPGVNRLTVQQLLTSDFFSLLSTESPETEEELARISDLLAKRAAGRDLASEELDVLKSFERDVASALPVGSSEVHRLVQDAVATYLANRRQVSDARLRALKASTKKDIIRALERI